MVSYLTIQGHLLGEETSTRAREAESQTTKPMGIERERDAFFFFYFIVFQLPLLSVILTNTPYSGKLPVLLPPPACHMWFQSANQALRLQGSFRQVSL